MKTIELKQLLSFAPYNVKGMYADGDTIWECDPLGDVIDYANSKLPLSHFIGCPINCKLILYPLSWLTKEIEHNGEKVVPLIELAKIAFPKSGVYTIKNEYIELGLAYSFHINIKEMSFDCRRSFNGKKWDYTCYVPNQLQLFQKLFEWHFDCFSLIKNNLAIDKSTIK